MSAAKFTKGPWRSGREALADRNLRISVERYGGRDIAFVPLESEMDAVGLANAKLIAAAPSMFAALEKLAAWDTERNFLGAPHVAIVEEARKAIKIATE